MNDLVVLMDDDADFAARYPDYKLYTYAYNYSFAYPTVSNTVIKACDKVAVMICPSADNYMKDLFNSANSESKKALEGWSNYCADLMVWMYDANGTVYGYRAVVTGFIYDGSTIIVPTEKDHTKEDGLVVVTREKSYVFADFRYIEAAKT